ncbi:MAG: YggS family pyridoxal phosphate-dependent enzyme [Moraxellaceae bacterium]|jgi:pyridoxal phosphate enzyme (YggS family)|nr:YggS family pyridoxal phosphate-dependent enzyme [Moraxellaceae bacterium]
MSEIAENLRKLRDRIDRAEAAADRLPGRVRLLAVSKTQPAEAVRTAFAAGQAAFGENYVQEGLAKIAATADLPLEWHFIGPLQSNKTREVAEHFHWIHSVDREKVARRLAEQRPAGLPPLQVCLQVNIDDEAGKSGCTPADLPALVRAVLALPRLELRGLMCIPRPGNAAAFADLAKTRQDLLASIPGLSPERFDTLSMGMSDDLEAAIAAGSTLVRIGTAIFGARPRPAAE